MSSKLLLMALRSPYLDDSKVYPPLGILYLKSAVEEQTDTKVDVVDEYDLSDPKIFEPYDFIGLSVMTPQREEALKVLKVVKENYPDKKVIIGGPHALHYTRQVMKEDFDYIVRRDGQRDLVKILKGEAKRIGDDKMGKSDWAKQPRPDRTSPEAVEFLRSYNYELQGRRGGTMLTATGCPEKCTFCFRGDTKIMTPKGWRLIKNLRENSEVLTFNEKTGEVEKGKIKKKFKRKTDKFLRIWLGTRKYLDVTHEHPFYQYGKWIQAKDLKKGDILHTLNSQVMEEVKENYSNSKLGDKNPMKRPEVIAKANSLENYKKRRKNGFGVVKSKPNNSEKKLIELISKSKFEFIGNKSLLINGYNPDFIHRDKRKIIEMFGCYWHNCSETHNKRNNNRNKNIKEKDKIRIKKMKEAGYEVLIIWEHELDNPSKLIKKVWNFETNGVKIHKIIEYEKKTDVYNFECDNNTYFAEGVLVHNCEDAETAVRWSPLDKLKDEMDDLQDLGYKGIYIFDDLFAIALPMIKPICEELSKRDLIYRCNGQARYFTKFGSDGQDMAKLLGDTGCAEIAFGHETGSQKILDNILKRTSVEQNYKSIEYAKKQGIYVKSFILLGLPGEDWETLADTERFVREGGMDDCQFAVYMPYKGTKIRDAIDRGESVDLQMMASGSDGEISGAYGIKGGKTAYEVRTKALSQHDLEQFRDHLVNVFKPRSHKAMWEQKFHDTHLKSEVEYDL